MLSMLYTNQLIKSRHKNPSKSELHLTRPIHQRTCLSISQYSNPTFTFPVQTFCLPSDSRDPFAHFPINTSSLQQQQTRPSQTRTQLTNLNFDFSTSAPSSTQYSPQATHPFTQPGRPTLKHNLLLTLYQSRCRRQSQPQGHPFSLLLPRNCACLTIQLSQSRQCQVWTRTENVLSCPCNILFHDGIIETQSEGRFL